MTWCDGDDSKPKCGDCAGCLREERDRLKAENERLTNTLESIRFGEQKHYGLKLLKELTQGVTESGQIRDIRAWAWWIANYALHTPTEGGPKA